MRTILLRNVTGEVIDFIKLLLIDHFSKINQKGFQKSRPKRKYHSTVVPSVDEHSR